MESSELNECIVKAKKLANYYLLRFPFFCDMREDIQQVALLGMLQADKTFDPSSGTPRMGYLMHAAHNAVNLFIWKQQWWPLHAPDDKVGNKAPRKPVAPCTEEISSNDQWSQDYTCQQAEWWARTQEILEQRFGSALESEIAKDSILGESSVSDIAKNYHVDTMDVYRITERAKVKLRQSSLRYLLRN